MVRRLSVPMYGMASRAAAFCSAMVSSAKDKV